MCVFDGTYYKITTTNYISKTSLYTTFRMYPLGPWAAENLDVCTTCDSWDSNIQLTMGKDQRQQIYVGFVADIDIKILGVPRPASSMPFLNSNTCTKGGVIYFCQGFLPCMMPSMDGWRDEWMDGKLHEKWSQRPLLYVISMLIS